MMFRRSIQACSAIQDGMIVSCIEKEVVVSWLVRRERENISKNLIDNHSSASLNYINIDT